MQKSNLNFTNREVSQFLDSFKQGTSLFLFFKYDSSLIFKPQKTLIKILSKRQILFESDVN